jgi:hypothetical protein
VAGGVTLVPLVPGNTVEGGGIVVRGGVVVRGKLNPGKVGGLVMVPGADVLGIVVDGNVVEGKVVDGSVVEGNAGGADGMTVVGGRAGG